MKSICFAIISCFVFVSTGWSQKLEYQLSMSEPHTHYFEVSFTVSDLKQDFIDFKMPTWAPGSYLIREFSKNVEDLEAKDASGKSLPMELVNKNTWRVHSNNAGKITMNYRVYAFEMSVRTSFLDASHGYLNGTSIFMYVDGLKDQASTLSIEPFQEWKMVSTSLEPVKGKKWTYHVPDYDILGDSPIEIGNHEEVEFTASGVKHRIAIYGHGNYDKEALKTDMGKIVDACTKMFGENPNKEYLFIVHNLTQGSGGLEHLNSTTLQVNRWTYQPESTYHRYLSLVAHEYFHLWNVKRIRPAVLGPFDYENENYTNLLWVMEGFTSYYDELLLKRAGFYTEQRFFDIMSGTISRVENQPGNQVQPVAESSFYSWIKAYRPNENSYNTGISYYSKGSLVAMLLDLEIIKSTNGEKKLDDVMRYLYQEYYKKQDRGFTDEEFEQTLKAITGKDMSSFLARHVYNTETLPYNEVFGYAGLELVNLNEGKAQTELGAMVKEDGGKTMVTGVIRGTAAYESGLNVNDEIIAINHYRLGDNKLHQLIGMHQPGDKVQLEIARDGMIQNLEIELKADDTKRYTLIPVEKPGKDQQMVMKKWLE